MRLAILLRLAATSASAQGTGTIAGQVLEDDGITTVIGANVRVDGTALRASTDIDGNYRIIDVPAGTYAVTASFTGYLSATQVGIQRRSSGLTGVEPRRCRFSPTSSSRTPIRDLPFGRQAGLASCQPACSAL